MRIGELAALAGLTASTIRFYEQAGLLPAPPRTSAGYRDYPPETAVRLRFISDARATGLTLAEIRGILAIRDTGSPPCGHVIPLIHAHLDQIQRRIAELTATRAALRALAIRAAATNPADCTGNDICTILTRPAPALRAAEQNPRQTSASGDLRRRETRKLVPSKTAP
ncbi:MAG TPA: heavy metal-responsive transcriptional regulator [Streptosporangiaceae bacterium]|nr:heavy metal-responsive transcriptional regulator [Streptosporangiaceae bacterium]